MRVKIGPPVDFTGPYQIAERLFFWVKKYDENFNYTKGYDRVHRLGEWLSQDRNGRDSALTVFCSWLYSKRSRTITVKIHHYDVWSMDNTLAYIIYPLLLELKKNKQGSGFIDLLDVPELLRYTETEDYDDQQCFDFYEQANQKIECSIHTRYDWVLDEIIWAFSQTMIDWEEQYWKKKPVLDLSSKQDEKEFTTVKWKEIGELDIQGSKKHQERINNGLMLFGKYFQTFWT